MSNINRSNLGIVASAISSAGFDVMGKPLTPAKIANLVAPSITSTPNSSLSTSTDDSLSFVEIPVKDDTDSCRSAALRQDKENNATALAQPNKIMLLRIMISWPLIVKKLYVGCRNWNGHCEQDDNAVKHANTATLHYDSENNATARHARENEFAQKANRYVQ